jgi:hypothetical protein
MQYRKEGKGGALEHNESATLLLNDTALHFLVCIAIDFHFHSRGPQGPKG